MASRLVKSFAAALVIFALLGLGAAGAATKTGQLVLLTNEVPQPVSISVELGGLIIWLNRTNGQPLSLAFEGSLSPDPTCPGSVGFVRQDHQVFTLPALPPGGTASLCFPDKGSYSYKVYGLDRPISGSVTVGGSP
jgi:hypothetical protein